MPLNHAPTEKHERIYEQYFTKMWLVFFLKATYQKDVLSGSQLFKRRERELSGSKSSSGNALCEEYKIYSDSSETSSPEGSLEEVQRGPSIGNSIRRPWLLPPIQLNLSSASSPILDSASSTTASDATNHGLLHETGALGYDADVQSEKNIDDEYCLSARVHILSSAHMHLPQPASHDCNHGMHLEINVDDEYFHTERSDSVPVGSFADVDVCSQDCGMTHGRPQHEEPCQHGIDVYDRRPVGDTAAYGANLSETIPRDRYGMGRTPRSG